MVQDKKVATIKSQLLDLLRRNRVKMLVDVRPTRTELVFIDRKTHKKVETIVIE